MGTQARPKVSAEEFAAQLLAEPELVRRAQLTVQRVVELLPESGALLYLKQSPASAVWSVIASAGEIAVHGSNNQVPAWVAVWEEKGATTVFSGARLSREDYGHLITRRTVVELAYIPLIFHASLIGVIECATFEQQIHSEALEALDSIAYISAIALAAAATLEEERNLRLNSISRLTQLYDIEKVFSSTLELEEIMPIITNKLREVLDVAAVNLWLVAEEDKVLLASQSGRDPTTAVGMAQRTGGGIAAEVSESGTALLIAAEDPRLATRNASIDGRGSRIISLMAVPLISKDNLVGVVEAIGQSDGGAFDDDDLFFLSSLGEAAAIALENASLLQAERKVQILQTLAQVSKEITSTLNLERVLQTVVNGPGAVIAYERAAIALEDRGKLRLKAISGEHQVNASDPSVQQLAKIMEWASQWDDELFVNQQGDAIDASRPEARHRLEQYFSHTGMRAFYALPLSDDQGRVGILSMESSDPGFLSLTHREMTKILAAQATVALRNAQLYREVPFINVLEPLLEKKRKFLAFGRRRQLAITGVAVAVLLCMTVMPLPMRVSGNAVIAPLRRAQVQPEVEGVIKQVFVKEGDIVRQHDVVADLEDWEYRAALAGTEAKYQTAQSEMNRALAANDGSSAGIHRAEADYWRSEVERGRERLERTHLRAPIEGIITTAHIDQLAGRRVAPGDTIAQVEDTTQVIADVAVDERELPLLHDRAGAAVKLNGFANHTFTGYVAVISPTSYLNSDQRTFYARVIARNPNGILRPGMQGHAKISAGWHLAGYVFFRKPAVWIYTKLWSWFGW